MKFEIPFNAENEYREKVFLWKYTWAKKIRATWYYIIMALAPLLLLLLISKNDLPHTLLLAGCIGIIFSYSRSLIAVEKHRRAFLKNIRNRAPSFTGTSLIYEFTEEHFIYADHRLSYTIKWEEFQNFISSSNILLIKLKHQESYHFIISKHEFGEESYASIVKFLETKMQRLSF